MNANSTGGPILDVHHFPQGLIWLRHRPRARLTWPAGPAGHAQPAAAGHAEPAAAGHAKCAPAELAKYREDSRHKVVPVVPHALLSVVFIKITAGFMWDMTILHAM